ncbi:MAG: sigma-70 family RNA polymerase sigma factor [Flavobacteriales bacterium]|nr:sigma-70 family RNA polymerase sigma factor [Flavobacteriales bacterium]
MEVKETVLINRALGGEQSAFAALLGMYWGEVYAFLSSKNICDEDAEDLCIETFSKAFEKLSTYDSQYSFKTWLLYIARNNYVDFMRKNSHLMTLFSEKILEDLEYDADMVGDETPESRMIEKQSVEQMRMSLERLQPRYREVMRLYYIEEMSVNEISARMDISLSNVKVILMRARKMLCRDVE